MKKQNIETKVIKSINKHDLKTTEKSIDKLGIRKSLRSKNSVKRKMAISLLLDHNWWLVEGYTPKQIGNMLSCIYGVGFSWNLFGTPIAYLTEFRRRAEE